MLKASKRLLPTRGPLLMALAMVLLAATAPATRAQKSESKASKGKTPTAAVLEGPAPGPRYTPRGPGRRGRHASGQDHRPRSDYYPGIGCLDYDPKYEGSDHGPNTLRFRTPQLEGQGALALSVEPEDTQVFLNGHFIGTAGDFDGWPRYLWLDEDVYELILYKEGYETFVREVAVLPDVVAKVEHDMQPGASTSPDALTRSKDRGWDDSSGSARESYDRGDAEAATGPGRLALQVSPPEASIYIDGRFVGMAAMVIELEDGLLIEEGEHRIQILHPRFRTEERTFTVTAGEAIQLDITMGED